MSIHVYALGHAPITHRPFMHVSRSTAHKWLLWGTHEEIGHRAIRVVALSRRRKICHPGGGVPEKMPMLELPGIYFEEPLSAPWREAHRKVTFHARQSLQSTTAATSGTTAAASPR